MTDTEHLDRLERFTQWLEERREQAGYSQTELAERTGMSHSYYSKLVNIGRLRAVHGDVSRKVPKPKQLQIWEGALQALEERLGEGIRDEGIGVWSSPLPDEGKTMRAHTTIAVEDTQLLSDTLAALMLLPPDRLKLVRDIIDKLK